MLIKNDITIFVSVFPCRAFSFNINIKKFIEENYPNPVFGMKKTVR